MIDTVRAIAIIGAGRVGSALGQNWHSKGVDVTFGVRDPGDAKHEPLRRDRRSAALRTPAKAARDAQVVVFATPWPATREAVQGCGDLSGKIVLDCTNPVGMVDGRLGLVLGWTTSGGEQVAGWASGASVYKSLNTIGYEVMADPTGYPRTPVMFVAGDDEERKPLVLDLVARLGFDVVDAGPLLAARWLEAHAMLWIHLAVSERMSRRSAFALMRV